MGKILRVRSSLWRAQAGCKAAEKLAKEMQTAMMNEQASSLCGDRPPLPLAAPSEAAAAEQLLSADAMLQACPNLESARCARVEVHPTSGRLQM